MGNKNGTFESLTEETKEQLAQRTGMSPYDLDVWYKEILGRSKKGKLSKEQMVNLYKELSDLDSTRIEQVVDSLANVFDEDHSGSVDINEFMRGFILTTKGDLTSKIDYTFRIYDTNNNGQISGREINNMANAIMRVLGAEDNDETSKAIVNQFLNQFTGGADGIITKTDFQKTVLKDQALLALLSPFYGT